MHTHTESESYDHKLETLLGVTSTDGMSVGALGLRVGQERRDFPLDVVELGQSRLENQSHASAWNDHGKSASRSFQKLFRHGRLQASSGLA